MKGKIKAILFDLDGTIIDTAPEMVEILYEMLKLYKYPLPSYKLARSYVSKGSFKLIQLGFPNKSNKYLITGYFFFYFFIQTTILLNSF